MSTADGTSIPGVATAHADRGVRKRVRHDTNVDDDGPSLRSRETMQYMAFRRESTIREGKLLDQIADLEVRIIHLCNSASREKHRSQPSTHASLLTLAAAAAAGSAAKESSRTSHTTAAASATTTVDLTGPVLRSVQNALIELLIHRQAALCCRNSFLHFLSPTATERQLPDARGRHSVKTSQLHQSPPQWPKCTLYLNRESSARRLSFGATSSTNGSNLSVTF